MLVRGILLAGAILFFGGSIAAQAAPGESYSIERPSKPADQVPSLVLELDRQGPKYEVVDGHWRALVVVRGKLGEPHWTLTSADALIPPSGLSSGPFEFLMPLTGMQTPLHFFAVHSSGKAKHELLQVRVVESEWAAIQLELKRREDQQGRKRWGAQGAVGLTYLAYRQSKTADYNAWTTTVKLSGAWALNDLWDFAANAFVNVVDLNRNRTDASLRFLGVNLRAGFSIPQIRAPWRLTVMGGLYYVSMFVTDRLFGFTNMVGPQVYPVLRREFSDGSSAYAYFKFSPVTSEFQLLSLGNNELAVGGGYVRPLGKGVLVVMADVSQIALVLGSTTVMANSYTLSAGYGF